MQLSFILMKIIEKLKLMLYVVTQIKTGNWLSHTFEYNNICRPQDPKVCLRRLSLHITNV